MGSIPSWRIIILISFPRSVNETNHWALSPATLRNASRNLRKVGNGNVYYENSVHTHRNRIRMECLHTRFPGILLRTGYSVKLKKIELCCMYTDKLSVSGSFTQSNNYIFMLIADPKSISILILIKYHMKYEITFAASSRSILREFASHYKFYLTYWNKIFNIKKYIFSSTWDVSHGKERSLERSTISVWSSPI